MNSALSSIDHFPLIFSHYLQLMLAEIKIQSWVIICVIQLGCIVSVAFSGAVTLHKLSLSIDQCDSLDAVSRLIQIYEIYVSRSSRFMKYSSHFSVSNLFWLIRLF